MTDDTSLPALAVVVDLLCRDYPQADPPTVVQAVLHAQRGLTTLALAADDESTRLLATIAERELRLRLLLDDEDARLDPETHSGRRT